MRSLAPFAIALALACASCAQTPPQPEPAPAASAPDYAELHRQALEHLAVGDMHAVLLLVDDLPRQAPEGLGDPSTLHVFARLRRLADLVEGMHQRGITSMTLRREDATHLPFESRPRT